MLHCEEHAPSILDEIFEAEEREAAEAQAEAMEAEAEKKQAQARERLARVLIKGDTVVEGYRPIAEMLETRPQNLRYGIKHHPELAFIRRVGLKIESMQSSLQAVNPQGMSLRQQIETRVRQEQQDRGEARGKANKKPQIWHGLPCKPPPGDE